MQELTLILNIIGQYDIKHILMSPIKTITTVLKISTYIITAVLFGLAAILGIMSVRPSKVLLFYIYLVNKVDQDLMFCQIEFPNCVEI